MRRVWGAVIDWGPVVTLALIAAAGSFTHIRDLAERSGQHGWMAWAIAVSIDLTCVMAARERHRDTRLQRVRRGWVSWPTLVLVGAVALTLAANLATAQPTVWGWIMAGTPAAAFLVAVSMLERRAGMSAGSSRVEMTVQPVENSSSPLEPQSRTPLDAGSYGEPQTEPLLSFAQQIAAEHYRTHQQPITVAGLRSRLGVAEPVATRLHEQLRNQ